VLACGTLVACGSSGPKLPAATRVCRGDLTALRQSLGDGTVRIASSDPADIRCRLSGGALAVEVEAQASPQAWTQFDTIASHAAQAFGPGSVHQASSLPIDLAGLGYSAIWIPSQSELYATNGTQSQGGSFVTVIVTGRRDQPFLVRVAERVATATLTAAPRGPSPGPAPS